MKQDTPRRLLDLAQRAQLSNKEIAYQLGISEGTVKVYMSRFMRALGLNSRTELALWYHMRYKQNDQEEKRLGCADCVMYAVRHSIQQQRAVLVKLPTTADLN